MEPGRTGTPSTWASPDIDSTAYSKSGSSGRRVSVPAARAMSAPTIGLYAVPGEAAVSRVPRMTVAFRPGAVTCGSSAWCWKCGSTLRWASGRATHSWAPCRSRPCERGLSSEWLIPRPEVIRPSSRGRIVSRLPRLSRCSTSPSCSQLTVWSPEWGWGATCMPGSPAMSSGP